MDQMHDAIKGSAIEQALQGDQTSPVLAVSDQFRTGFYVDPATRSITTFSLEQTNGQRTIRPGSMETLALHPDGSTSILDPQKANAPQADAIKQLSQRSVPGLASPDVLFSVTPAPAPQP